MHTSNELLKVSDMTTSKRMCLNNYYRKKKRKMDFTQQLDDNNHLPMHASAQCATLHRT